MCLLETKELASALRLSEFFLRADYHLCLFCSRMDQRRLLPLFQRCHDENLRVSMLPSSPLYTLATGGVGRSITSVYSEVGIPFAN